MSKTKAAAVVTGTLRIITPGQDQVLQGTLVEQTAEYVTLDVKRRGSKKTDRTMIAAGDIKQAWISETVNETYLTIVGETIDDYDVELVSVEGGYFSGTSGDTAVLVAPGLWQFLPNVVEDEDGEPAAKPAAAKPAAAKPAAGKGKPAPEPEPEEEQEEEQEEEEYEPEVGHFVTVTEDEEETTGEVEALTSKLITVAGTKFKLADVTVVQAERPEDDTPEEEPEAYEPADGDYVKVTEGEDEVEGDVTGLTAKKITVTDAEGEEHVFLLSKVTVEAATKPKAKAAKPAAAKPAADKPAGKPAAGKAKAAADDSDW